MKTQQQSQIQQRATNKNKEDDSGKDLKVMSIKCTVNNLSIMCLLIFVKEYNSLIYQ